MLDYSLLNRSINTISHDSEWDGLLLFACYWYNFFPSSNVTQPPFLLMHFFSFSLTSCNLGCISKAEEFLDQPAYKPIPTDPITKYKNKLISLLKTIRGQRVGSMKSLTQDSTPQGQVPLNSMGCPKYTKKGCQSDPQYPA